MRTTRIGKASQCNMLKVLSHDGSRLGTSRLADEPARRGQSKTGDRLLSGWRGQKKSEINPMDSLSHLSLSHVSHPSEASRCGAKTRASTRCQSPPVQGRKRCRLHGGLSPGAPRDSRNGNYTNGEWTRTALEERRWVRDLVRSFGKFKGI